MAWGGMLTLGLGPAERVGHADLVLPDLAQSHLHEIISDLEKGKSR